MAEAGDRGRAALEARDWVAAVAAFEQAAAESAGPGDWEGLAVARRWSGDLGGAIVARERAYHLYRAMPDEESAARVAAFLALDVLEGRGNTAVAAGWLARARDLLRSHPQSVWLSVVDGIDGALAGVYERDFPRAAALLHSAADSARTVGMFDAALLSEAQLGLVLVLSGAVSDGLRLLDGATTAAVSGEIGDPSSAVAVCCLLTAACLSIRDLARAAEWSQYACDLAADRGGGTLFDYPRTDRAALRILQGDWPGAEQDLRDVIEGTQGWSRPAALARLHLADLSRRRGRFEQASALLAEVSASSGRGALGPLILLTQSHLALDREDFGAAQTMAQSCLASTGDADVLVRTEALELLVRDYEAEALPLLRTLPRCFRDIDTSGFPMTRLDQMEASLEAGPQGPTIYAWYQTVLEVAATAIWDQTGPAVLPNLHRRFRDGRPIPSLRTALVDDIHPVFGTLIDNWPTWPALDQLTDVADSPVLQPGPRPERDRALRHGTGESNMEDADRCPQTE